MSKRIITCKIDCTKIEKARLFEGMNGAKYLDLVLIETPDSKYGDFMITQSISKEERERGVKGPILGNGKYIGGNPSPRRDAPPASAEPPHQPENDEVPF